MFYGVRLSHVWHVTHGQVCISWVKSPWNCIKFFLEYPFKSLNVELEKMCEPCHSFLAKVWESQGTWVQKARENQGTFLKKLGGNPVTQFCIIRSHKSLKACLKSKLTNLKNWRGVEGGWWGLQKSIYIETPSVWSFSGITHTRERRQGVPCMSSTRLTRSGLPSLI